MLRFSVGLSVKHTNEGASTGAKATAMPTMGGLQHLHAALLHITRLEKADLWHHLQQLLQDADLLQERFLKQACL
jgi:hypothetical protein